MGRGVRRETIVKIAKPDTEYKVREVKSPYKFLTWGMRLSSPGTWDTCEQVALRDEIGKVAIDDWIPKCHGRLCAISLLVEI